MGKKKKRIPSVEELAGRVGQLDELLEKIRSGEVNVVSHRETISDRMEVVRGQIYELRMVHKLPYRVISEILKQAMDFEIDEKTLRNYCVEILGCPTKKIERKVSPKEAKVEADVAIKNIQSVDPGSQEEATLELAQEDAGKDPENPLTTVFEHKQDLSLRKEKEPESGFGGIL